MKKINIFGIVFILCIGLVLADSITLEYNDVGGEGDFTFDVVNLTINYVNQTSNISDTTLTPEEVEDIVGGMTDGYETYITVTYNDTGGNINYIVTDAWWNEYSDFMGINTTDKYCTWNGTAIECDSDPTVSDIWVNESGDIMTGNLNITSNNSNSVSRLRVIDSSGEYISIGRTGTGFVNPSTSSLTSSDGDFNFLNLDNTSNIVFLISDTGLPQDAIASFTFTNDGELQFNDPNKKIYVETGDGLVFENNDNLTQGSIVFKFQGKDSDNNTLANAFWQNGKNNSFSGIGMNSVGNYPKSWVINNTKNNNINYSSISNYINYCDYLQDNGYVTEGCKNFADTSNRFTPLLFGGDGEFHRSLTVHEGFLLYDNFNYIDRDDSDANFYWSNLDSQGKIHVINEKQILANLSEFSFTIANFDDGTISLFESESISPEILRDWISIDEAQCFNERCARARAGNDKIMTFTGDTTFSGGTINATETNISFYLTTDSFGIGDTFSVILNDNIGNSSTIYSQTTDVIDEFVNVAFPSLYLGKSNVTTIFNLSGTYTTGFPTTVYVDEVEVFAIPDESILINESYEGGKITFGDDSDPLTECYIEKDKIVNNATQITEGRLKISCENVLITGEIESASSTITEQNITGNSVIQGNLTVFENLHVGGGFGDTGMSTFSNGDLFTDGNLFIGGNILNVYDQSVNGSIIPYSDGIYDIGNSSNRFNDGYFDNQITSESLFIGSSDTDHNIFFFNTGGAEKIYWQESADRFRLSDDVYIDGTLEVVSSITSNTVNTGQGDYELYAMNQNVLTTSEPSFTETTITRDVGTGATLETAMTFDAFTIQQNSTHACMSGNNGGGKICVEYS